MKLKFLLDIPFKKSMIFWGQYLKSIRMEDCYQFCKEHSYEILSYHFTIKDIFSFFYP